MFEREMSSEMEKQLRNVASGKLVLDQSLASEADCVKSKADAEGTTKPEENGLVPCVSHQENTISPSDLIISAKVGLLP